MNVTYHWRGDFENAEVNALHAEGFAHRVVEDDWKAQLHRHSLGWVCARDGVELIGFVNVAWDGGIHAFILDTLVARRARQRGVGTRMVALAEEESRAAGCEWLHADFDDELSSFYMDSCRFVPTRQELSPSRPDASSMLASADIARPGNRGTGHALQAPACAQQPGRRAAPRVIRPS